jgi:1,4-alpha-glucan branching enzyme
MTPAVRSGYRIPLPNDGQWRELLNSDAEIYGGSGQGNLGSITAVGGGADLTLPPLSTIMLEYEG